jgi:hypothetical protein
MRKAVMLATGRVSRNAPSLGERFATVMTATTTSPATTPRMMIGHVDHSFHCPVMRGGIMWTSLSSTDRGASARR